MVRTPQKKTPNAPKPEVKVEERIVFADPQLQILNNKIDWVAEQVLAIRKSLETSGEPEEEGEEDEE